LRYTHKEIERLLDGLCLRAEKKRLPSRWWPVLSDPEELAAKEGYSVTVISHRLQPKRNRVG
jgi:hypothetical protein